MDAMIDIETMSTHPDARVASIGCVLFEPTNVDTVASLKPFMMGWQLDMRDQEPRRFDADTVYWWLRQTNAARQALQAVLPTATCLDQLTEWLKRNGVTRAWSYGATFDHVILASLYRWAARTYPIRYDEQLCMRTVIKLYPQVRRPVMAGEAHNAIDDAVYQTIWLQQCLAHLRKSE